MANDSVGQVRLDLEVNTDGVEAKVKDSAKKISNETEKVSEDIEKTVEDTEEKIKKILDDSERSLKSKAAAIGGIYRKQGLSASDAMKKAWEQIERNSSDSGKGIDKKFKDSTESIKESAKSTEKSVSGIASSFAAAFAVDKLVSFGKECIELGSDLAEVQNVVDVTFPHMSKQIESFSKEAAASFGLSETMAKKYSGTFGSMAEAFGFTEKEAADMATTLTGLAGDVASFYNISQDEAYTKLKSVFSGETETLKDLGVVMTQSALDSYALANGFGKVTSKMTEAEKVTLRYAFVQDKLKNATGDFARTSDSWANQTKILALQFESLKATIGQALINIFSPVLKVINTLLGKLSVLASAFKAFTELITGKKGAEGSGVGQTADMAASATDNLSTASDSANKLAGATTKAGKAAKKAAKDMLGLMSFDELNNVTSSKDSSSNSGSGNTGGGAGGAGSAVSMPQVDYGSLAQGDTALDDLDKKMSAVIETAKKLAELFKKGFSIGIGDISVLSSIKSEIASIKKSFNNIISDKGLQKAVKNWAASLALNFGKVTGSIASVGLTIADVLLGGISKYLEQHSKDITKSLTNMFNISADVNGIVGDICTSLADIFTVFRSDDAKQITADLLNILSGTALNAAELCLKIGKDILDNIAKPITDNKDKIKEALSNTIKPIGTVISAISDTVSATWEKIQEVYDKHGKPLIDSIGDGISSITRTFLDGYNKYIAPVLTRLSKGFKKAAKEHIQPAIDAVIDVIGDLCDTIKVLWEKWLKPFVNWAVKNIMPVFAKVFQTAGNVIGDVFSGIADVIKGISIAFSGICKAIQGLVTGDWTKAWEGVKQVISGVWSAITAIFQTAWKVIKDVFKPVGEFFSGVWKKITSAFSNVKDWFKGKFDSAYSAAKGAFANAKQGFGKAWSNIKSGFGGVKDWFKGKFDSAYSAAKGAFANAKTTFTTIKSTIQKPFENIADWFKQKFTAAWTAVKNVFSTGGKVFSGIKDGIASTFKTIVNGLISGINKIIKVPFDAINGMLNKIRDVGVGKLKPFSGLWGKNPLSVPKIPALAQGGFVKANTPQLAMIGDNRHQGEVVAPENKLQALLDSALQKFGDVTAAALIPVIERLCNAIISLENNQGGSFARLEGVSDSGLYRIIKNEQTKENKRHGGVTDGI